MSAVAFEHVVKRYGDRGRPAVDDCSLAVEEGQLVILLGPSGCGKTTLLKMVNRLIEPTAGRILVGGTEIHDLPATELRRRIGYVIQQTGLFPHMTVEKNIAVVPDLLHWEKRRTSARIDELLEMVGLPPGEYRKRRPRELSGGQQQRVGLARALAADPALLLMDEPFGAIDAITRTRLQDELLRIQQQVRKTVLFVTHDVEEALRLADLLVVMRDGHIVQAGPPRVIVNDPADAFVAQLVGADDPLRRLSVVPVSDLMRPLNGAAPAHGRTIAADADARAALALLIDGADGQSIAVTDASGKAIGILTLRDIERVGGRAAVPSP